MTTLCVQKYHLHSTVNEWHLGPLLEFLITEANSEELRNVGINSTKDRTYFLLQIERIRAASRSDGKHMRWHSL